MSHIDNIIIQIRARLQAESIKLWEQPYYYTDVGIVECEIERLARKFSQDIGISVANCKHALTELQDGALKKLAARQEYEETGVATLNIRYINNQEGIHSTIELKCSLNITGSQLGALIGEKLAVDDENQIKCISAGKIINSTKSLASQGLKNNQQVMVVTSQVDKANGNPKEAMYDRIRNIKMDIEAIVDSNRQLFEMEDQDGNPVFLPPEENRALLLAMGYCEKARAAIKRQHYDEALILLLEADELFTTCNSSFLETIDNYALVNLDIVWCYLCLKNVAQLPDAQRRLEICEKSFQRSYGKNLDRLTAIKGNGSPERALIMRLHLLQGVVFFHQNSRDEAFEMFEIAGNELRNLKVDDVSLELLIEMGYEPIDARMGLRACSGNIEEAINFIQIRKEHLNEARRQSKKERSINVKLTEDSKEDTNWVNPRSVCTLIEMGYSRNLVVEALKRTENDIPRALDLLQGYSDDLSTNLPQNRKADEIFLEQLTELGFNEDIARIALETTNNNIDKSIDFLVKLFGSEDEIRQVIERSLQTAAGASNSFGSGPSTSTGAASMVDKVIQKAKAEMESLKAYQRFHEDLTGNEDEYLDLPLLQEEQILIEYKRLLEQ